MKLVLDPIWPWPLVVFAIALILAVVLTTYVPRIRHLPLFYRRLLLGLRLAAVTVLALVMLRPSVQRRETDSKSAVLLVIVDKTRSAGTKDVPGGMSRRQAMLKLLADLKEPFKMLAENLDVRYYDFAEKLTPVEEFEDRTEGQQTAIGAVLEELLRETRSQRIIGVVLMTDGAQRAVEPYDADPREQARLLGGERVPVYPVPFGSTGLAETAVDLVVEDLLIAPVVFEKKLVYVDAKVRVHGAGGRELTVQLLVEDRAQQRPGQAGEMVVAEKQPNTKPVDHIRASKNGELIPVRLSFVADRAGEFKVGLRVLPVDGELKTANNQQATIITVRSGGINVAYFDKLTKPEQKWIRHAGTSENIQIDFKAVFSGQLKSMTRIEPEMFEPGKYDAYIIGDVPARIFGPNPKTSKLLNKLVDRVEDGAGLMMIGGYDSFGPGGYADNPRFADLLPVVMDKLERRQGNEIDPSLHHNKPLQMLPTRSGLRHFVMLIDTPDRNAVRWRSLAPLEGANLLRKKGRLTDVLAATREDYSEDIPNSGIPLLFAQQVDKTRVLAFAGDTTYQWYLAGQEEAHQQFWSQVILWLTGNEEGNRDVWVRVDRRNLTPHQTAGLTFGARTPDGQPISNATFEVTVTDPTGTEQPLPHRRSGSENHVEFSETREPGDYWVHVSATFDTVVDGESKRVRDEGFTRFIVDPHDLEMDNPAADLDLLKDIASSSRGSFLQPEELGSFLLRTAENDFNTEVTKLRRTTLWDNWPVLLVFVSVMSVEWFVRKRRGLV